MKKIISYLCVTIYIVVCHAQFATQELDNLNTTTGTAINQSLVVGNSTTSPFPPLELDLGTEENPWRSLYFTEEGAAFIYLFDALFMHNTGGTLAGGFRTGLFLGENAGENVTSTANGNVGLGYQAMQNSESGSHNTAVGWSSLKFLEDGVGMNTMVGSRAGQAIDEGEKNTGIGWNVFYDNNVNTMGSISGNENVGIGGFVFKGLTSGSNNTVVGYESASALSAGNQNVIIGNEAGDLLSTGSNNTILGNEAGNVLTTGSENIIIGNEAELAADAESEMNIGAVLYAELDEGKVSIGNSSGNLSSAFNVGSNDEFQLNNDGIIVAYNGMTTAGNGVPAILKIEEKVDQNTALNNVTLISGAAAGYYRVTYVGMVTKAATDGTNPTGSALSLKFAYKEPEKGGNLDFPAVNTANRNSTTTNAAFNSSFFGTFVFKADAGDITYSTAYVNAMGTTSGMEYLIRITIEKI